MADPDPKRGVFRWAWHRAGNHAKGLVLGVVAFTILSSSISGVSQMPEHPNFGDHVRNAAIGAVVALVIVVCVAFIYALFVAPYEQRNALRKEVDREHHILHTAQLTVLPFIHGDGFTALRVTNEGDGSVFQATAEIVGKSDSRSFLPWQKPWDGPDRWELLNGAHGFVDLRRFISQYRRHAEGTEIPILVRFLSLDKQPFEVGISVRERLRKQEVKLAEDEWEPKSHEWHTTIARLIALCDDGVRRMRGRGTTPVQAWDILHKTYQEIGQARIGIVDSAYLKVSQEKNSLPTAAFAECLEAISAGLKAALAEEVQA